MAGKLVIMEGDSYPIPPRYVDERKHFFDAFKSMEKEVSARYIVRLCQRFGEWNPFTRADIEAFYNEAGYKDFWFNGLDTEGFVVLGEDGNYRVTHEFVVACFKASPAVVHIKAQK
jgi:hypothetical protein